MMKKIYISSERLLLVNPKIEILEKRLKEKDFYEDIPVNGYLESIHFPAEWPGAALGIFPSEIERRRKNPDILPYWNYNLIDINKRLVVGDICCKTEPNEENEIEIGYGINSDQQRRGYATEAVSTLISYIFNTTDVISVKAESNVENFSSIRVLEKCGFEKTGNRFDEEDGNLIIWKKRKKYNH